MSRYRIKIALLSLGMLLGYGSAAFHFARGHHHEGRCINDWRLVNQSRSE